jgi:hypothetical protein
MNHIKQAFISQETDEKQACFNGNGTPQAGSRSLMKSSSVSALLLGILDHAIFSCTS